MTSTEERAFKMYPAANVGNYSKQVDDGEHGKTRTRQKAREKMYSASSAGNCVREENILAVIWLRKGGEQIFETMNAASRGKSKEAQKWVSHLLQVMQEEIVNSDNILWSKIELWSKKWRWNKAYVK